MYQGHSGMKLNTVAKGGFGPQERVVRAEQPIEKVRRPPA